MGKKHSVGTVQAYLTSKRNNTTLPKQFHNPKDKEIDTPRIIASSSNFSFHFVVSACHFQFVFTPICFVGFMFYLLFVLFFWYTVLLEFVCSIFHFLCSILYIIVVYDIQVFLFPWQILEEGEIILPLSPL
jgi:hypothetical protein